MTWDELAPHWHLFEADGFNASTIEALRDDGIAAPIALVGAGIGTYAAILRDQVGDTIAVDGSAAMLARAARDHGLRCVQAGAERLPFADAELATAICATGVIESIERDRRVAVVHELARVAKRSYVCAFAAPHREGPPPIEMAPVLERWRAGAEIPRFDALAAELGDRDRAFELLIAALPAYQIVVDELDFIDDARRAGVRARRVSTDAPPGTMLWRLDPAL